MRYRRLSDVGDFTFGQSAANFLVDSPACVAQAILTRLKLFQGEWFLDTSAGMPWGGFPLNAQVVEQGQVLGSRPSGVQDLEIQAVILDTLNVTGIASYSSTYNGAVRSFTVEAIVNTAFGPVQVSGFTNQLGVFELDSTPLDGTTGLG